MATRLPIVMPSNNPETASLLEREFPGRLGTLFAPGNWRDPMGVPYALDNGRYSTWSTGKDWNEESFLDLLDAAAAHDYPPVWVVVPDVIGNPSGTLEDWSKWSRHLQEWGWPLALVVQKGITPDLVRGLVVQPDVIFIGGGDSDWKWRMAKSWCKEFPRVHIGKVGTVKQLWMAHRVGAESTDSNVWRPVGEHLDRLREYLKESGKPPKKAGGFHSDEPKEKPWGLTMKVKDQRITDRYALYNGDCCKVLKGLPTDSVGFSVFSPPFADLYSYSDSDEDLGNCRSYDEFFEHFGFVVSQLLRVMMPGRIVAVHCMHLPVFKNKENYIGIKDFPGDIIRLFQNQGFLFHSPPITVWKDPLVAATRTKALGLAHKQIVKDSAECRTGIPDFILAFRKPGANPEHIRHPEGLTEYVGERSVPRNLERFLGHLDPKTNKRSHWIWQQYASPVWMDIRQGRVLPYKKARDKDDEKHICPLQLDCIERCLVLWSNPGDVVLTPFMGVGSEVYVAVELGRRGLGIELKSSYFRQAVRNLESLKTKQKAAKGFAV